MTDNPNLKGLEWPHVKESKTVLDSGYPDSNSKNFPDLAGESGFPCIGQFKPRFSEEQPICPHAPPCSTHSQRAWGNSSEGQDQSVPDRSIQNTEWLYIGLLRKVAISPWGKVIFVGYVQKRCRSTSA